MPLITPAKAAVSSGLPHRVPDSESPAAIVLSTSVNSYGSTFPVASPVLPPEAGLICLPSQISNIPCRLVLRHRRPEVGRQRSLRDKKILGKRRRLGRRRQENIVWA